MHVVPVGPGRPRSDEPRVIEVEKPAPRLEDVKLLSPEDAQRNLSWIAQHAAKMADRIAASRALAAWRKQDPVTESDADRVPPELVRLWRRPHTRRILKRMLGGEDEK